MQHKDWMGELKSHLILQRPMTAGAVTSLAFYSISSSLPPKTYLLKLKFLMEAGRSIWLLSSNRKLDFQKVYDNLCLKVLVENQLCTKRTDLRIAFYSSHIFEFKSQKAPTTPLPKVIRVYHANNFFVEKLN